MEVAKKGFKGNIFGNKTYIDSNLFLNIFDMLYKHFPKFTDEMLNNHLECITPDDKSYIEWFCNARQNAYQKKWYKALDYIQRLNHDNNYTIAFRKGILTIQFQYEILKLWNAPLQSDYLTDKEIIDSEDIRDTCRLFLKSLTLTKFHQTPLDEEKERVVDFIRIVKTFLNSPLNISEIENGIKISPQPMSYEWLLKQTKLILDS